jgi:hypothetical protein
MGTDDLQYDSPFVQIGIGAGEDVVLLRSTGGYHLYQGLSHGLGKDHVPVHGQSSWMATHWCRPPIWVPNNGSKSGTQHFFIVFGTHTTGHVDDTVGPGGGMQ